MKRSIAFVSVIMLLSVTGCGEGSDSDDASPTPSPTPEACDLVDNNGDGTIDEGCAMRLWFVDQDQDGYGTVPAFMLTGYDGLYPGFSARYGDCDDSDPERYPEHGCPAVP